LDQWASFASILDPYVLLLMNNGEMVLMQIDDASKTLSILLELKVDCLIYLLSP